MKVTKLQTSGNKPMFILVSGTLFISQSINSTQQIHDAIVSMVSPNLLPNTLENATQQILQLYPDDPALGSPYGTGNDTFGLSSQYKRWAAICKSYTFTFGSLLADYCTHRWGYRISFSPPTVGSNDIRC